MPGKPTAKNELVEQLMEASVILGDFAADVGRIIDHLNHQESLDHDNDRIRNESIAFLLSALEAFNARDYEGMQKFTHAGVQRLHKQSEIDFKDDKPRADVRITLSEVRCKAALSQERIVSLIGKLGRNHATGK